MWFSNHGMPRVMAHVLVAVLNMLTFSISS